MDERDHAQVRRLLSHAPAVPPPLTPSAPPVPLAPDVDDTIYLKIWELEQVHVNNRWTVATFFLSVSFAIFGFSFQAQLAAPLPLITRIVGLAIYWLAFALFQRFNSYTRFLRGYLRDMERTHRTTLDVQTRAAREMPRRSLYASRLLFVFGLLYTVGVALLAWLLP
jgi:hypothetical protein